MARGLLGIISDPWPNEFLCPFFLFFFFFFSNLATNEQKREARMDFDNVNKIELYVTYM